MKLTREIRFNKFFKGIIYSSNTTAIPLSNTALTTIILFDSPSVQKHSTKITTK